MLEQVTKQQLLFARATHALREVPTDDLQILYRCCSEDTDGFCLAMLTELTARLAFSGGE